MRALLIVLLAFGLAAADATVTKTDSAIVADLGNGTVLTFALDGEHLLGLNQATVGGTALTSPTTVQRPLVVQEFFDDRVIAPVMKYVGAEVVDGRVEVTADLLATNNDLAYRAFFVYTGDLPAAKANLPADLVKQRDTAAAAKAVLNAALDAHEIVAKEIAKKAECEKTVADGSDKRAVKKAKGWLKNYEKKYLPRARAKVRKEVLEANADAAAAAKTISAYDKALKAFAVDKHGIIHRDFYRFAHLRLPAEICTVDYQKALVQQFAAGATSIGQLKWIVEPKTHNIAGWPWAGWQQSYAIALKDDRKVNCVRQLGTWELNGQVPGLTAVAARYRGLGRIEQPFTADAEGGAVEAWTTTEIIPGAAGGGYAVSPSGAAK